MTRMLELKLDRLDNRIPSAKSVINSSDEVLLSRDVKACRVFTEVGVVCCMSTVLERERCAQPRFNVQL